MKNTEKYKLMLHCNWLPFPLYSTLGNKQYITAQNDLPYDFSKYMMTDLPKKFEGLDL